MMHAYRVFIRMCICFLGLRVSGTNLMGQMYKKKKKTLTLASSFAWFTTKIMGVSQMSQLISMAHSPGADRVGHEFPLKMKLLPHNKERRKEEELVNCGS